MKKLKSIFTLSLNRVLGRRSSRTQLGKPEPKRAFFRANWRWKPFLIKSEEGK
jgi:hypothetical protein